jgi:hypothetical protein
MHFVHVVYSPTLNKYLKCARRLIHGSLIKQTVQKLLLINYEPPHTITVVQKLVASLDTFGAKNVTKILVVACPKNVFPNLKSATYVIHFWTLFCCTLSSKYWLNSWPEVINAINAKANTKFNRHSIRAMYHNGFSICFEVDPWSWYYNTYPKNKQTILP